MCLVNIKYVIELYVILFKVHILSVNTLLHVLCPQPNNWRYFQYYI